MHNSSSLCCAVLGDRHEWLHRMPHLIFRLYGAIWQCFIDIQQLLHLGNEKNALYSNDHSGNTAQGKGADLDRSHTAGQAKLNPWPFIPPPSQCALRFCVVSGSDRADLQTCLFNIWVPSWLMTHMDSRIWVMMAWCSSDKQEIGDCVILSSFLIFLFCSDQQNPIKVASQSVAI